jgi:signal transduction histidine kinase
VPRRSLNLRTIVSVATVVITAIALFVAGALILLTTRMHELTVERTADIESVRTAEDAEVALLLLERSTEPLGRARLVGELRDLLATAERYVNSDEEAQLLAGAKRAVESLVAMRTRDPAFPVEQERVFTYLDALADLNVAQARALQERALKWDRLGDVFGFAGGGAVLVVAVLGIWWLRARAFRPVFELVTAMEQFGRGNRAVRARDVGPAELREMVRRFNAMASALASQHDAQAAFLAAVAHDLRTPLGVLLTQLQIMSPDRPLPPEPLVRRSFEMVRRQLARLDRMLQDLVTFTGMDAGAFGLELADYDLVAVIRGAADLFDGHSSKHQLVLELPEEPVMIRIDRLRIEQVVTNLLSNAIKYSPAGGRVVVRLEREPDAAIVSVTDAGVGIPAEDQQRLFEPFTRLQNVGSVPGSGLGLYVVRRIVEAHGGNIEVDSEPGRGTTFHVRLKSRSFAPRTFGALRSG